MRCHSTFLLLCLATAAAHAEASAPVGLTLPCPQQATEAIVQMLELGEMQDQVTTKLGTCIAAIAAEHAGQVACTVSISIGAGTSETQVDFWQAQPSSSQEKLPFPDPAL